MGMAGVTVGNGQPPVSRRGSGPSVAGQVRAQRGRYANAVLQSLARSHRGQPAARVQKVLKSSLTPLGVRLSPTRLHQLATEIAAGRPVELSWSNVGRRP